MTGDRVTALSTGLAKIRTPESGIWRHASVKFVEPTVEDVTQNCHRAGIICGGWVPDAVFRGLVLSLPAGASRPASLQRCLVVGAGLPVGRVKNALGSTPSLHAPYSVPCGANCTSGESGIRKLFAFPWLREARSSNNWNTGCPVFRTVHSMRQIPTPLSTARRHCSWLQEIPANCKSQPCQIKAHPRHHPA